MTEAVFDFKDIKRRMDRKPAPVVVPPELAAYLAAELDWTQELTRIWDVPVYRTYLDSVNASGDIVRVWR